MKHIGVEVGMPVDKILLWWDVNLVVMRIYDMIVQHLILQPVCLPYGLCRLCYSS